MSTSFIMPSLNIMGENALTDAVATLKGRGFTRALIVTDAGLAKLGVAANVSQELARVDIPSFIFDGAKPNPTVNNVEAGLVLLKEHRCDLVVSLGGGSSHDCAKGIALVAANGGTISDYEGIDRSPKPQVPLLAINTTAGTAAEMTRFCIITDEKRQVKMAIVDKHTTPFLSVNDPAMMVGKPSALTAATGMDALTHAVEAYVSTAATPITDGCAIKAISLIAEHLRNAVADGKNIKAREGMAYAQFLAGMAFNNASLGYVHAMAHQLGGFYDLPHGVCNAILLPHVEAFNAPVAGERLRNVAAAMGVDVSAMDSAAGAEAALAAIRKLSGDIGIPAGLAQIGMKDEDIPTLAENALLDACGFTNPRRANKQEIESIFRAAA